MSTVDAFKQRIVFSESLKFAYNYTVHSVALHLDLVHKKEALGKYLNYEVDDWANSFSLLKIITTEISIQILYT